jgi:protein-L-isoaspartate(D-aspartate) O-methyltransferase
MVECLRKDGITNTDVLNAIAKVPRHLFVPKGFEMDAYENRPLSIGAGQTISQPFTVALQTELLQIRKFDKVLEIGTGSGYQAAILSEMRAEVYTVERIRDLHISAKKLLEACNYVAYCFWGDGFDGRQRFAPFRKILITAAIPEYPQQLLTQLAVGGRLVAPVGASDRQTMTIVDRISETEFKQTTLETPFKFVPMLTGTVR